MQEDKNFSFYSVPKVWIKTWGQETRFRKKQIPHEWAIEKRNKQNGADESSIQEFVPIAYERKHWYHTNTSIIFLLCCVSRCGASVLYIIRYVASQILDNLQYVFCRSLRDG